MYSHLFKMDGCNFHDNHDTYFGVTLSSNGECNISNTMFQHNNLQSIHNGAIFSIHLQNNGALFFHEFHCLGNNTSTLIDILTPSPLVHTCTILTLQVSNSLFKENYLNRMNRLTLIRDPTSSCIFIDYAIINSTFVENQVSGAMFVHGKILFKLCLSL